LSDERLKLRASRDVWSLRCRRSYLFRRIWEMYTSVGAKERQVLVSRSALTRNGLTVACHYLLSSNFLSKTFKITMRKTTNVCALFCIAVKLGLRLRTNMTWGRSKTKCSEKIVRIS
jgi:hypothetical protein